MDLLQQGDEALRRMIEASAAALGVGIKRIAAGSRRMQVLRLPAETDPSFRREVTVVARELDRQRREVRRLVHLHEVGPQRQHHRGLD